MSIPADKLAHLKAGAVIAGAAFLAGIAGIALSQHLLGIVELSPLAIAEMVNAAGLVAAASGVVAGLTKEYADKADNVIYPGMHGVELLDAVATAAPGLLLWLGSLAYLLSVVTAP